MPVPYLARRVATMLAATSLVLSACSDASAPAEPPFEPLGTTLDAQAFVGAFAPPIIRSYYAASDAIAAVVAGRAPTAQLITPPGTLPAEHPDPILYLRRLARWSDGGSKSRPTFAAAGIPGAAIRQTFAYDIETEQYVPTGRPGAPPDGARFLLYAVNPYSGLLTEPLTEVGYAQLVLVATTAAPATHVTLVKSEGATPLEYTVTPTSTASSVRIALEGSATSGAHRATFDMSLQAGAGEAVTLAYVLEAPARGFRVEAEMVFSESAVAVDFEARGEHGRVTVTGTLADASGGTLTAQVNGERFATITVPPPSPGATVTMTGTQHALTPQEQAALDAIFTIYEGAPSFFTLLVLPAIGGDS